MNTALATYQSLLNGIRYQRYEVDPAIDVLKTGDMVTPDTIVGFHRHTSRPVTAGLSGRVLAIYFNRIHGSVMMLAVAGRMTAGINNMWRK
ncbi:MAG: hypothetical protein WC370_09925 [Dehalococcoidales bacterium]|jgi:hypothetical protein